MQRRIFALTVALAMMTVPVFAQNGRGGGKPTTKPHSAPAPKPSTAHGSHTTAKVTKTSPPKVAKTTAPKAAKAPKAPKSPAKTVKTSSPKAAKTGKTSTSNTTIAYPTPTTTTTTPLTPVQQKLQRNTNLAAKLQSRLPAGTDLNAAAAGFRNLGQFVAAVNVSNNLGISFTELKMRMVDQGMSLGQAIQDSPRLTSTTDTTAIVRRAEADADVLIRTTESTKAAKKPKTAKAHK
jgi:hypothetical protein